MEIAPRLTSRTLKRLDFFRGQIGAIWADSGSRSAYLPLVKGLLLGLGEAIGRLRGLRSIGFEGTISPSRELLDGCDSGDIPVLYQQSLSSFPRLSKSRVEWLDDPTERRRGGVYYTPTHLVEKLLDFVDPASLSTVCDPACGSGAFLIATAKRGVDPSLIVGADCDSIALELCRLMFWLETGKEIPSKNLVCCDSLQHDWADRFDVVIGNPPFGGVVDGRVPEEVKALRSSRLRDVGGTADLSSYFASLALQIVKPGGRIGLVLPRAFLSARSSAQLRAHPTFAMELAEACREHDSFEGAAVHVALVGFAKRETSLRATKLAKFEPNHFGVSASMTVSEAYDLLSSVTDTKSSRALKLMTTGLIDPGKSLWGVVPCRYLKSRYRYPRVAPRHLPSPRRELAARPKLLVAGLSRSIECYLDRSGEYAGSVGTYTLTHHDDDAIALENLMQFLHSPQMSERFRRELGPSALGGGNITLTKSFLKQSLAENGF